MERQPIAAGRFYPGTKARCEKALAAYFESPSIHTIKYGGIAPHAGWSYSGQTAAYLYAGLANGPTPDTIVIAGAVHRWGISKAGVFPEGSWRTPLGAIQIDVELATELVSTSNGLVTASTQAHAGEHSIEVHVPFVQYCFPKTRLLAIAVPPNENAANVGQAITKAAEHCGRHIAVIGSTDLTHYGAPYGHTPVGYGDKALNWTHENDKRFLARVTQMDSPGLLEEASSHQNACGAGAVSAAVSCALAMGSQQAQLLHYTTSYEVDPVGEAAIIVGYAAMAFV